MYELNQNIFMSIASFLREKRNFDINNLQPSLITRRLNWRITQLKIKSTEEYFNYLTNSDDELDELINAFLINYSKFFRNPLLFEYVTNILLPRMLTKQSNNHVKNLRIWSVGCASGEEPYSIAIIINEFIKKNDLNIELNLFATDIDSSSLAKANKGVYSIEQVDNVKHGLLKKYFSEENGKFLLSEDIKNMVSFSKYVILNNKQFSPNQSIFGDFDIVFCRNLLIYYNRPTQEKIFNNITRSIANGGYLILGKVEKLLPGFTPYFETENNYIHLYKKH
ncbi:MAG: protein-glutamate O-methyltransferase CheR [Melioribacteraceae bacterium]|jgi:chemotaxis protein methyltransferase CheR|nr:protein-glutamate O-methyltransferase CheR [Melioribacteraceae bacterium]